MMTRITAVFLALLSPTWVAAGEPLYVKNLSPIASLFGLPAQQSAAIAAAGTWQWDFHSALASHYIEERRASEALSFDGETQRLVLAARYALSDQWQLQLELPYSKQSAGFLDTGIDRWHNLWGLPDNGRSDVPRDQLNYRYADSEQRFDLYSRRAGLGDISLAVQRSLYRAGGLALAGTVGYKFGTGDFADFSGSGEADSYAVLRLSSDSLAAAPLSWHAQLGYLRAAKVSALAGRQQRDLWFAGASAQWQFSPSWSLLGQLDAHKAPLASAIDALAKDSVMLSAGLRWQLSQRWGLDFSIVEDIAVETAPDVMFQASLRYLGP
ncbi:DUF3187 family protein [Parahaliea sp. F7430]|uniref:DUF3187 family protein n=1 Tax=Sediminihaliea albiluteola TaxID=2758564 RepID=A0A7W2YJ81_9GAMM|nr:DUF3187 family protein [Sediminihaliea albiluteola]MBA6413286.1 DUF3187 family protein [Sediminihaliea albiluteola]